jgi:hypothetical protein
MTFDFGRDRDERALSVVVPRADGATLVHKLRPAAPTGWLVFVGTDQWLGDEQHKDAVEIVIGPGSDQFDILRLARSDAINYGMGTEELIRKLKSYDATVGLDILQANTDTVVSQLLRLPTDPDAFVADVYAFCPDIVDQGTGTVAALRDEIQRTRVLFLWWD